MSTNSESGLKSSKKDDPKMPKSDGQDQGAVNEKLAAVKLHVEKLKNVVPASKDSFAKLGNALKGSESKEPELEDALPQIEMKPEQTGTKLKVETKPEPIGPKTKAETKPELIELKPKMETKPELIAPKRKPETKSESAVEKPEVVSVKPKGETKTETAPTKAKVEVKPEPETTKPKVETKHEPSPTKLKLEAKPKIAAPKPKGEVKADNAIAKPKVETKLKVISAKPKMESKPEPEAVKIKMETKPVTLADAKPIEPAPQTPAKTGKESTPTRNSNPFVRKILGRRVAEALKRQAVNVIRWRSKSAEDRGETRPSAPVFSAPALPVCISAPPDPSPAVQATIASPTISPVTAPSNPSLEAAATTRRKVSAAIPKGITKIEQFSKDAKSMMRRWLVDLSQGGVFRLRREFYTFRSFVPPNVEKTSFLANLKLCRYKDVPCYESTRVVLNWPENVKNDFIHANWVKHELLKNVFICTQGPKEETVFDFWRMVWQERTKLIIMLCNLTEKQKPKCHQYWPSAVGQTMQFDRLILKTLNIDTTDSSINVTKIQMQYGNECRTVYHRHWVAWPDKSVPKTPLTPFRLLQYARQEKSPVVVHCSAGIGRTGTLVLTELILNCLKKGNVPDLKQYMHSLRAQRAQAVQTEDQYAYAHYAIVQMLHIKKVFTARDIAGFCKEYLNYIKLISELEGKKVLPPEAIPPPAPGTTITCCEADMTEADKKATNSSAANEETRRPQAAEGTRKSPERQRKKESEGQRTVPESHRPQETEGPNKVRECHRTQESEHQHTVSESHRPQEAEGPQKVPENQRPKKAKSPKPDAAADEEEEEEDDDDEDDESAEFEQIAAAVAAEDSKDLGNVDK